MADLDRAIAHHSRWAHVVPEKYRDEFYRHLQDPSIYSMREDISLLNIYISRLVMETGLPPARAVEGGDDDRLTMTEAQAWNKIQEALELKMKMVGQDVKTLDLMAQHSGRQAERAQALTAIVLEVLRQRLADTSEGRKQLTEIADELEARVRELQGEEKE